MIARNFYEGGFSLFFPQINWGGSGPGYVGTEFPLVPFLAALGYQAFGETEWLGRSVSLLFLFISLPFLYRLYCRTWNPRAAIIAIFFYLFTPLVLATSVSFTPDMTACSLAVIALERFASWMDEPWNNFRFTETTFSTTLALLVKSPYILFGLPMLYMAYESFGFRLLKSIKLWTFALVTLLVSGAWYLHAYIISVNYFPHHMFGLEMLHTADVSVYRDILLQTFFWGSAQSTRSYSGLTPVLTVLMVGGLFLRPQKRFGWVFHWLLMAMVPFTIFAGLGSRFPPYQLPIAVVASAMAGRACDHILCYMEKYRVSPAAAAGLVSLVLVLFSSVSYVSALRFYEPWATPYKNAGIEVDKITPENSLIVLAADLEPTTFYYSKRRGWHFDTEPGSRDPARGEDAIHAIETYRALGGDYLVIPVFNRSLLDDDVKFKRYLDIHYRLLRETADYTIYDISRGQ
jgi:4-amino-4-deoxy-L-arabinose transferase-like glycosyltransferase